MRRALNYLLFVSLAGLVCLFALSLGGFRFGDRGSAAVRTPVCEPLPPRTPPGVVLAAFVREAVFLKAPGCVYDHLTRNFKSGVGRREWRAGGMNYVPIRDVRDWGILKHFRAGRAYSAFVRIASRSDGTLIYYAELKRVGYRWLVDSWNLVPNLGVPGG